MCGFPMQYILLWETYLTQLLLAPSNQLLQKPDQFPSQIVHPTASWCCTLLTWWPVLLEVPWRSSPFCHPLQQEGPQAYHSPHLGPSSLNRVLGRWVLDWWLWVTKPVWSPLTKPERHVWALVILNALQNQGDMTSLCPPLGHG